MSAIDWTPGPQLRALKAEDAALVHMARDVHGGWGLTVRIKGGPRHFAAGLTAQEAADHMERIIGGEG